MQSLGIPSSFSSRSHKPFLDATINSSRTYVQLSQGILIEIFLTEKAADNPIPTFNGMRAVTNAGNIVALFSTRFLDFLFCLLASLVVLIPTGSLTAFALGFSSLVPYF